MDCSLGIQLNNMDPNEIHKERIAEEWTESGGKLKKAPNGPIIPEFAPIPLAQALEQEIRRAHLYGWPKISLHMDILDAAMLAAFLRRT